MVEAGPDEVPLIKEAAYEAIRKKDSKGKFTFVF